MNRRSSVKRAPRPSRTRSPDARPAQLLDAAATAFAAAGFHATTMSDVARRAGVSVGLAYRYFDGKEALVEALVAAMRDESLAQLERALAGDDVVGALLQAGEAELLFDPPFVKLYAEMLAEACRNPRVAAILASSDRALRLKVEEVIARGQERGQVAKDVDRAALADLFFALADGLCIRLGAGLVSRGVDPAARLRGPLERLLRGTWLQR